MGKQPVIHVAGGRTGPLDEADGLVWLDGDPSKLPELPRSVRWVQLPSAGVEQWLRAGVIGDGAIFTSAVGSFGLPVAEHALALILAGAKALPRSARARSWDPGGRDRVRALEGA